jgi:hypothetical protein
MLPLETDRNPEVEPAREALCAICAIIWSQRCPLILSKGQSSDCIFAAIIYGDAIVANRLNNTEMDTTRRI